MASNLTHLPTVSLPSITPTDSYETHRGQCTPLIIDNGSTTIRFGFSTSPNPFSGSNVIAKYKERKYNKPLLLFGAGIEVESGAKGQARAAWEGDVLLNFDALVCSKSRIHVCVYNDPIFWTEA
jgi:actin-related protein 5